MIPFVASQAIALAQAKQTPGGEHTRLRVDDARASFVSRVFEAIAQSRMRQAEIALARYRRPYATSPKR